VLHRPVAGRAEVAYAYQWDALAHIEDLKLYAETACRFALRWQNEDRGQMPAFDDMRAFLADVEVANARGFSDEQRRRLAAHLVFEIALFARTALALGRDTDRTGPQRLQAALRWLQDLQ